MASEHGPERCGGSGTIWLQPERKAGSWRRCPGCPDCEPVSGEETWTIWERDGRLAAPNRDAHHPGGQYEHEWRAKGWTPIAVVRASRLSLAEKRAEEAEAALSDDKRRLLYRAHDERNEAARLGAENERLKARIEIQTDTILAYYRYTGIVDVEELREASDEEGGT